MRGALSAMGCVHRRSPAVPAPSRARDDYRRGHVLDPRIYRAALVPVLVAVLVAAFSLENRPRPIGTTLAPDAFSGEQASLTLERLAAAYPRRRPGDAADEALARRIAQELEVLGPRAVRTRTTTAQTIEGERELTTVIATRIGAPGPGLAIVAHRDAAGAGAKAELSGTAAMLELARVAAQGRVRRTISFISTSGGSGGAAGAAAAARALPGDVSAVLVLGDLAGAQVRKPFVTGFSNGRGQAPLQLRRTVEAAVRAEVGVEPGGPRAPQQWARLAVPFATGEQGELLRADVPAVLLSVSGERGPRADTAIVPERITRFGRAALRAITALDNGPTLGGDPQAVVLTNRKVLPQWAVRLLVGVLLLPVLLVAIDGLARARRRKEPVGRWALWVLATALPYLLTAAFAVLFRVTGLLQVAPRGPAPPGAVPVDGNAQIALVSLLLVFVLGWIGLRPLALQLARVRERPAAEGAGIALILVSAVVVALVWLRNPYAAALLIPALHGTVLIAAGGVRLPRVVGVLLVLVGLLPAALAATMVASALGYTPADALWAGVLAIAGGHVGPLSWLVLGLLAGCGTATALVALARRPPAADADGVTVRGPVTYAGPGALGGVDSALRR
ncbi:M28 family peptidase [Conexibacter sp. W3-3-2]|nr:M28 family peptidase [Conexibacter sp. W3-3-2]